MLAVDRFSIQREEDGLVKGIRFPFGGNFQKIITINTLVAANAW